MKKLIFFIILVTLFCTQPKDDSDKNKQTAAVVVLTTTNQSEAGEFAIVKGATEEHNKVRRAKGIPELVWDNEVANYSKSKIEYLANQNNCVLSHSAGPQLNYGENLFWGSSGKDWSIVDAVESWVKEEQYYTYNSNTCQSEKVCGHYTQVVWKNSKKLGCYKVVCSGNKGVIIGCNYDPPGNVTGEKPY